ncbi:MAG TPA: PAS domain-containing sensor histidine kinase [Candidatus Acidoferrum sp.]|nr:PAS domain-containing sensor histidine kinase [Candidatus Angelobacter sp.]HXD80129.1 PAS domain-containing sensor histidine kinase [Candidatus Acidoferrum sp.]
MSTGWRAPWGGARDTKVFFWSAAATVVVIVGFVVWVELRLGGDRATIALDDIGEGVAALIAAICTGLAARRNSGRSRLGWVLLSASAATWCAGEAAWSVYEVGMTVSVPYPSVADAGFLGAIPLAIAGVLMFFSPARGTSTSLRLWLDGAIILVALFFVSWTLGLKTVVEDTSQPFLAKAVSVAYPLGDIVIGTIVVLAARRAREEAHGRLLLLLGGLAANSLADSAFAYLNANGTYGAIGSVLDVGWVAGYLMIALAALWPAGARREITEGDAIDVWQLALPWVAIGGVGLTAIGMALTGNAIGPVRTFLLGAIAILVMVTQVYAHNESRSLLIKTQQYAATLNEIILYAPLGVVRIGLDMTIIQANPRLADLLRRPEEKIVGTPLASHFPAAEAVRAAEQFGALSSGSATATESETEAVRSDGTSIWLHWSTTAVHRPDGQVDYFIAMFDDTTARHQAEVSAVANISVLERLNRLKSEFLTMVSHEIRTALVGIQGFSELLRDTEDLDLPMIKGFAGDIYNDAHHLDEMLDRMLDVDRIEASKVEVHLVSVDLGLTLYDAIAHADASGSRHTITTDIDIDLPAVAGDAARLAQVIEILFSNAFKYSPAGSDVTVSAHRQPGQVVIGVRDRGVGVPPDFDEKLFARYQWSANNPTTKVMGTGLGLPLARQIVEMHGGRIWFESTAGAGSEFHFSVPVQFAQSGRHELQADKPELALVG